MTVPTLLTIVALVGCAGPAAPATVASPACPAPVAAKREVPPAYNLEPPAPWPALPRVVNPIALTREIVVDKWSASDLGIQAISVPAVPGIIEAAASATGHSGNRYMLSFKGSALEPWFVAESGDRLVVRDQIDLDRRRRRFPAVPLAVGDANPWQLTEPVHIIRAEVNGGAGSTEHSVVLTNATVIDGTAVLPIDLSALVRDLKPRIEAAYAMDAQRIQELRAAWEKTLPPDDGTRTATPDSDLPREIIWRDQTLVILDQRVTSAEWIGSPVERSAQCEPGQPCQAYLVHPGSKVVIRSAVRHVLDAKTLVLVQTRYRATATISHSAP